MRDHDTEAIIGLLVEGIIMAIAIALCLFCK